ncbi:MAG: hypothetical protein IPK83_07345 [Planctomycetes bacterium]|nr:hypothetical protein [Planctomycetota bacterium]
MARSVTRKKAASVTKKPIQRKSAKKATPVKRATTGKTVTSRRTSKASGGNSTIRSAPIISGIGDDAVRKATGQGWKEWIALIDDAGGAEISHAKIAEHLAERCNVAPWWSQMVTVGYEQAKGRRVKHEKPAGYEIGVSKTLAAPVERVFEAWHNPAVRKKWLVDHRFSIRKATPFKSMRIDWVDGKTRLSLNFYSKRDGKSLVTVQHMKLTSSAQAKRQKAYWAGQLQRLSRHFGG